VFVGHGGQKLFGWFGGGGIGAATEEMEKFGLRPGRAHGLAAGAGQFGGGVLLLAGFLTPAACTVTCSTMLTALWAACLPRGFFARNGGIEYPLLLLAGLLLVAGEGPGPLSLDHRLDLDCSGVTVAALTLVGAAAGSSAVYLRTRGS